MKRTRTWVKGGLKQHGTDCPGEGWIATDAAPPPDVNRKWVRTPQGDGISRPFGYSGVQYCPEWPGPGWAEDITGRPQPQGRAVEPQMVILEPGQKVVHRGTWHLVITLAFLAGTFWGAVSALYLAGAH